MSLPKSGLLECTCVFPKSTSPLTRVYLSKLFIYQWALENIYWSTLPGILRHLIRWFHHLLLLQTYQCTRYITRITLSNPTTNPRTLAQVFFHAMIHMLLHVDLLLSLQQVHLHQHYKSLQVWLYVSRSLFYDSHILFTAIRFKESPFLHIEQILSSVVECPGRSWEADKMAYSFLSLESASSTDRRQQHVTFSLSAELINKLRAPGCVRMFQVLDCTDFLAAQSTSYVSFAPLPFSILAIPPSVPLAPPVWLSSHPHVKFVSTTCNSVPTSKVWRRNQEQHLPLISPS